MANPPQKRRQPDLPLRGERVVLRRAVEEDVNLLVDWHADPDIARYWDGENYSREEMLARLARPDVDPYVIEADGDAVGYLQAWFADDAAGLDMFLVPSARGRGLGPEAALTLGRWLLDEGGEAARHH